MIAAIIPAAGLSSRMGQPKPLLDLHGRPLLGKIIDALRDGGARPVIVVTPPFDRAETEDIIALAHASGAVTITPMHQTSDMRASLELGLELLETEATRVEGILLCPCDTPGISASLVAQLIAEGRALADSIVVPISGGKRGHPVYLPREVVARIRTLPPGQGVKSLFDDSTIPLQECTTSEPLDDIDTPEDYRRWNGRNPL